MSLHEVGLDYLPDDIKRPAIGDKIQELVIPLDYAKAEWLSRAVQDTADIIEASFSSKMLATINADMPIWDRYVVQNLCLDLKGKTKRSS